MFAVVGVGHSLLSGEHSDDELTDEFDRTDLFPKLETFPDSSCSSGSLSELLVKSSSEIDATGLVSLSSSISSSSTSSLAVVISSDVCELEV